jgi:hypothetical protein
VFFIAMAVLPARTARLRVRVDLIYRAAQGMFFLWLAVAFGVHRAETQAFGFGRPGG